MLMMAEPWSWVLREESMGPKLHSWKGVPGVEGVPARNQSRAWNLGL